MSKSEKGAATKGAPAKDEKVAKRGVGTVAIEAIRAGKTNEETLAVVKKEFPEAKTTMASINWYRNKLRGDGDKSVKTSRELKTAAKKAADPLD
ncbi:MAG: hypothetical protein V3S55_15290 [Nitrospiraceae bacterium]